MLRRLCSSMARQTRKKQEQLSFPELAFLAPITTVDAEKTGNLPEAAASSGVSAGDAASDAAGRSPRRASRPRMVVVREGGDLPVDPPAPDTSLRAPDGAVTVLPVADQPVSSMPVQAEPVGVQPAELPASNDPAAALPDLAAMPSIPAGLSDIVGHVSLHLGETPKGAPVSVPHADRAETMPQPASAPISVASVAPAANRMDRIAPAAPAVPSPMPAASVSRPAWLRGSAQAASLLAAVVTVGVLSIGLMQFIDTQRVQRELAAAQQAALTDTRNGQLLDIQTRAVDLLLRYNELTQQTALLSPRTARKERLQRELLALGLLDTLYTQTRGMPTWEATLSVALERHQRFVREQRLNCSDYTPGFLALLEKVLGLKAAQWCRD